MARLADPITFSVPRKMLADISHLSAALTDRMHQLLEKNTDNALNPNDKAELDALVSIAQFGQIVTMALHSPTEP